ncbi:hypothetical protein VitviT2T_015082 [Vitis vinifera]|uniref:Large ribosomal subunit protein bL21m n=1 Tax=Vitis vinifera TaxID=29760 RepID=A0ABY9CMY2_VITVI|nr:large ribosomal subunit protein bL21m [Vitis vinifera]WJZ96390.1 hypothetical protein VitviT2T_015082 [Vitis vinifera]
MANRRCLRTLTLTLTRHDSAVFSSTPFLQPPPPSSSLKTVNHQHLHTLPLPSKPSHILRIPQPTWPPHPRHFSSHSGDDEDEDEDEDEEEDDDEEMGESSDSEKVSASNRVYSAEDKERESAAIGYKVVGPLQPSDRVFKPYEPVFAVVQIGSHQFKVSNGDCIYTERLKFCEVNDRLILNRVLLIGSTSQTIVGRPTLPDVAVHAVVEEHALDAKVIIFKKKRRKNYRRTKGHRQELTRLRITDIQGIEKPEIPEVGKSEKAALKKPQKVAVAA